MGKKAFLQYCTQNGIPDGTMLYEAISKDPTAFIGIARQTWPSAFEALQKEHAQGAGSTGGATRGAGGK